jgi:hypothetical protein
MKGRMGEGEIEAELRIHKIGKENQLSVTPLLLSVTP